MEALVGKSLINSPFSSQPCLITGGKSKEGIRREGRMPWFLSCTSYTVKTSPSVIFNGLEWMYINHPVPDREGKHVHLHMQCMTSRNHLL